MYFNMSSIIMNTYKIRKHCYWCLVHCAVSHLEMELTFAHWFLSTPLPIALADPVGTANQLKSQSAFILHSAVKSGATINQDEGPIGKGLWNATINQWS